MQLYSWRATFLPKSTAMDWQQSQELRLRNFTAGIASCSSSKHQTRGEAERMNGQAIHKRAQGSAEHIDGSQ